MGYESKIFIVERYEFPKMETIPAHVSGAVVAEYDLCKMGGMDYNPEFYKAFKREIDYTLWLPTFDKDGNEVMGEVSEDCYGEHMKAATIPDLLSALKKCEKREHYRRLPPLIAMLEAFKKELDEWENRDSVTLEVVHYGY